MERFNCYEDARRASAYAALEFPGTYFLAYRDLPALIAEHVRGRKALDFGCGAGRSTRFLRRLGLDVIGVDISGEMIEQAHAMDPGGDYRLIESGDLRPLDPAAFGLVLSAFTFDNIPTGEAKVGLLRALGDLLTADGRIINLVSSPEIYRHEWASFSTRDYPGNLSARSGDRVRIVITAIDDPRPVVDVVWSDESYRDVFLRAALDVVVTHRPLGRAGEPCRWVNEMEIPPWTIYVLRRAPA